ncbi:FAD dependent oxidoreductase [Lactifluus subvellereus]|nr:FAD dependent oxidoreductase [Lactifluus subvellereus]
MQKLAFLKRVLLACVLQGQLGLVHEGRGAGYVYARPSFSENGCRATCEKIATSLSPASQVFYPGSQEFNADISHWANSSSYVSACSVEPGSLSDVGLILCEISSARVPFAVKGGGHITNPGFSSTPGVHISMSRFNDIVIHEDSETVEIGAGLTWTEVYKYLVPKGINVVGGRIDGVGVAGLTLGGGYSWKTNQYGLTVDTITEFELVLPDGEVKIVTEKDEDLWFALKGGFNNYGIVTKFTLKSHQQTEVWGAFLGFAEDVADVAQATFVKFLAQRHDHKAAQLGESVYSNGSVSLGITLFYDGPEPPKGLYDELLDLPTTSKTIFNGSFTNFILSQSSPTFKRVYFTGVPMLHYTEPVMKAFVNETKFWGERLSKYDKSVVVLYGAEPLEPDFLTHGEPSAYPPDRSLAVLPSGILYGWSDESADTYMADALRCSAASLVEAGIQDGQDLKNAAPYVNYALFGTPLEEMYGGHLGRLREIRMKYNPEDIMGLAGGWKF